jgi:hypothetical protein
MVAPGAEIAVMKPGLLMLTLLQEVSIDMAPLSDATLKTRLSDCMRPNLACTNAPGQAVDTKAHCKANYGRGEAQIDISIEANSAAKRNQYTFWVISICTIFSRARQKAIPGRVTNRAARIKTYNVRKADCKSTFAP